MKKWTMCRKLSMWQILLGIMSFIPILIVMFLPDGLFSKIGSDDLTLPSSHILINRIISIAFAVPSVCIAIAQVVYSSKNREANTLALVAGICYLIPGILLRIPFIYNLSILAQSPLTLISFVAFVINIVIWAKNDQKIEEI